MALFTAGELRELEREYKDGMRSETVVALVQDKGERFSEATLRKYVQLGLLPMSRRVGIRGRHRGSSGLYPSIVVRLINEIKGALEAGETLEDIRDGYVALIGEVDFLSRAAERTMARFSEVVARHGGSKNRAALRRGLGERKKVLEQEIKNLAKLAQELGQSG